MQDLRKNHNDCSVCNGVKHGTDNKFIVNLGHVTYIFQNATSAY